MLDLNRRQMLSTLAGLPLIGKFFQRPVELAEPAGQINAGPAFPPCFHGRVIVERVGEPEWIDFTDGWNFGQFVVLVDGVETDCYQCSPRYGFAIVPVLKEDGVISARADGGRVIVNRKIVWGRVEIVLRHPDKLQPIGPDSNIVDLRRQAFENGAFPDFRIDSQL